MTTQLTTPSTVTTASVGSTRHEAPSGGLGWAVRDTMAMVWRNLVTVRRVPQLLVFATVQPVIFVLLFRYVFGGAIKIPGVRYVDFLMPGIFAQTVSFGAINTAVGLAEDRTKGLNERMRSLPMSRSAVLAGRTLADTFRNVFVFALMTIVGFLVGFRLHAGVVPFVGGMLVLLLFGFSLCWLFAFIGLSVPNAEAAQAAAFPLIAPLTFASTAFVNAESMPKPLAFWARNQPLSAAVGAIRACVLGGPTATKVIISIAWSIGMVLILAPLAIWKYRKVN